LDKFFDQVVSQGLEDSHDLQDDQVPRITYPPPLLS
jgi:hypothetical protein